MRRVKAPRIGRQEEAVEAIRRYREGVVRQSGHEGSTSSIYWFVLATSLLAAAAPRVRLKGQPTQALWPPRAARR